MSKTGKNTKTQVCQGCLSSDRRLSPLGVHTKLLCRVLGDDTRIARTARNNISKPKQRLCWECHQMLLNVYKFQQRVLQAQSTLHLVGKQTIQEDVSLSRLKVTFKDTFDLIENYIDIEHHPFKVEVLDNSATESKIELDYPDNSTEIKVKIENENSNLAENNQEADETGDDDSDFGPEQDNFDEDTKPQDSSDEDEQAKGKSSSEEELEDFFKAKPTRIKNVRKRGCNDEDYKPPESLQKPKKSKIPNAKYRQIECNLGNIRTKFQKVPMDRNDLFVSLEKYRNSLKFKEAKYKCEKCVQDFMHEEVLDCHMKRHVEAEGNPYKCDICETFWDTQDMLDMHTKNQHMFKLECLLCGEYFLRRNLLFSHQDEMHKQTVECLDCGCKFGDRTSFWKHHRALHTTFKCDHCIATFHSKNLIVRHLRRKHRTFKCDQCNMTTKRWDNFKSHKKLRHTKTPTENTYCVECDKYFLNAYLLGIHLKAAKIHTGVQQSYPCSECGKEYRSEATRNDHYKFVHLKQFDHYCQICHKYFLYKSKLKDHIARIHEKVAKAKNKICQYCGRGFETKAILVKHIRTHTGERPFGCEFCSAAFAQRSAMYTHTRKVHGKADYMKPPTTTSQ